MEDSDDDGPTRARRPVEFEPFGPGDESTTTIDSRLGPGSEVGGYVIDGELGHGGMGFVYSATHPLIGKRAAIKVLKPEISKDPAAVERFVNEARAVNQIGHPNIVDIFAFGALPDGRSYYVMDLLTGEPLRARLKRTGALHISEAASIIDETASALIAAHAKGIIHRDLKPDNVFVVSVPGRWPEVRLLDWGLLKLIPHNPGQRTKYRTLAGSVMGTPVYMSPEQARASDSVDYRTDIYALGVMSYEILCGKVPFKGQSSIDTILAHQEDPVPSLLERVPTLPIELAQLIEAMLQKEPDDRPTLAAVRTVLKRLKGNQIPTMTAAGLQMDQVPSTPFVEPPTNSEVTVRGKPASKQPPVGRTTPASGASQMHDAPKPSSPSLVGIPSEQLLAGHLLPGMSGPMNPTSGSVPTGEPLPPAMDSRLPPVVRAATNPYAGVPSSSPSPSGQVPALPVQFPSVHGLLPVTPVMPGRERERSSRRLLVIITVAVIASTIGIILALTL